MRITVNLHVNLLVESLPAERTDERFERRVRPHVGVEVRRPVERLVTRGTDVGFYRCVRQSMTCQVARLSEST